MRTLVIGDIHGGYKALLQVLERAKVTEADTLIFLGDYVDGWSESSLVIQKMISLSKSNSCIFIRGNHDFWCWEWLALGYVSTVWFDHGGKQTISSYSDSDINLKKSHEKFFKNLKDYFIDKEKRLYIHAGFSSPKGVGRELYKGEYFFDRTLWTAAVKAEKIKDDLTKDMLRRFHKYKEIYIGHTPTLYFNSDQPMNGVNVWNIDTGAAFTGKLSIMDVDTKQFWQSDPLPYLYPDEKGRNYKATK